MPPANGDPVEVSAVKGMLAYFDAQDYAVGKQRNGVKQRFTTRRWLQENQREWYALDRLVCTRPGATRKDEPFPYPFWEATDEMRKGEGAFVGDEVPILERTRGLASCEVISQLLVPPEFPPSYRVILFTPEFGGKRSYDMDTWNYIEPEDKVDIWLVCWQGWTDFAAMINEVTEDVLTFGDGIDTVWYAQGMGAIVAYEVLKNIQKNNIESPNHPIALCVADCPAPSLFAETYKPYTSDSVKEKLEELPEDHKATVENESCMMMFYEYEEDAPKLPIKIVAFHHEGDPNVGAEAAQAWESCGEGGFELVDLGEAEEFEEYIWGQGYSADVNPAVLQTIQEVFETENRNVKEPRCEVGPTDGPIPDEVDVLIVGAGFNGITVGSEVAKSGKSMLVVDRHSRCGGIWDFYANVYSRVNTSEIGYRVYFKDSIWDRTNEDHTPTHYILNDLHRLAHENLYGKIRLNINVEKTTKRPDGRWEVQLKNVKTGDEKTVIATNVSFHVNRRIGKRRDVEWEAPERFKGVRAYGYANEVTSLKFWGKRVLVVGSGAFAFENLRTALEHGASHVTIMGRRDGSTCPKWIDMIAFLRPLGPTMMGTRHGNFASFEVWQACYRKAGLREPLCWKEGLLKPNNHTISVSDLAYIAGWHGMVELRMGECKEYMEDGTGIILRDGSEIICDIIIKATGFQLNTEVEKITGYKNMQPYGLIDVGLNYMAEPLLDGAQFGSAKDKKSVEADMGFQEADLHTGYKELERLKLRNDIFIPKGNPFGSGQGGPSLMQGKFVRYLFTNQEVQDAMFHQCGSSPQPVTELWASEIGQFMHLVTMRLVAGLAKVVGKGEPAKEAWTKPDWQTG